MDRKDEISYGVQEEAAEAVTGSGGTDGADAGPDGGRRPQRYKIYDRIADNVSLHTMNIVVGVVAALLVFFVIYGIATGNPPQ